MPNFFQRPLRLPKVPHSYEDMSHNFKTTTKFGLLTPVGVEEIAPSDQTRKFSPSAFMRLSPLLFPIMHRVNARLHTFEVPFRIILGDKLYEDFLNDRIELRTVYVSATITQEQYNALPKYDIFTSFGYKRLPFSGGGAVHTLYELENGLDILALLVIFRDWYADSNIDASSIEIIDQIIEAYQDSYASEGDFILDYDSIPTQLYARLGQDYFTTARPAPQYGDPVNLTTSPTRFQSTSPVESTNNVEWENEDEGGSSKKGSLSSDGQPLTLDMTIRELWRREQIQRYWDITNTFGGRTREWLAGHMGVIFPDDRLQIPRLLQQVTQSFNISEVMQTSESTQDSPLGAYAGRGTLAMRGKSFKRYYVEHALVMSLLSVIPVTGYANGLQRYQLKKSIFDFAIPEFNNIGYQEIYKGELYNGASAPTEAWGYTMRYNEYRSHPNRCSNGFSDDSTLIDFHLNRKFDSVPGLNPNFITANQDQFYRIFADEAADMDSILVDVAIIHEMYRPVSAQPSSMHL